MLPRIFVGSSTESERLAEALALALSAGAETTKWRAIFKLSESTLGSLIKNLPKFDFGVFVLSPDDLLTMRDKRQRVPRDNVIFELGMFFGHLGRERTFMLVPRGAHKLHLPTDLLGITYAIYDPPSDKCSYKKSVEKASEQILEQVAVTGVDIYRRTYIDHRDSVSPMLMSTTIVRSPFAFRQLLSSAKKELFVAAQNHSHISVRQQVANKEALFRFLARRGTKVQIMACDPAKTPLNKASIKAWSFVTAEGYKSELQKAAKTFEAWAREAESLGFDLVIRLVPHVPVSVTFVDPSNLESGCLVFAPNFYQAAPGTRPCYFLRAKEHRAVFDTYWTNYEQVFNGPKARQLGLR